MSDVFGVGKAIEKLMDPVSELVKKLAGPAAEEVGLSLQDSVKVWRAKRQYKLFQKMNGFIAEAGFEPKPIALKTLLPALDYSSVEEDEELHTAWASLLANAADPRVSGFVEPSFPTILRDLTSREVKFLDAFVGKVRAAGGAHTFPNADVEFIIDALKESFDEAGLSTVPITAQPRLPGSIPGEYAVESDRMGFYTCLDVLISHRLIEKHIRTIHHDALNAASGQEYETYSITALGTSFVRACQPPQK